LTAQDKVETALTDQQQACIVHWNELLRALPPTLALPPVPIWGDECGACYPFHDRTPWACSAAKLRKLVPPGPLGRRAGKDDLLELLPNYARTEEPKFPDWKVRFIRHNRNWWAEAREHLSAGWEERLKEFPPSLRKLEFNVRGAERDLWRHVLQFRPSGLRAKRYVSAPALVAMTESQVPILGPERRFLTRVEGLRLQGFPDSHELPEKRNEAFTALGNAVHVGVVRIIAAHLLKTAHGDCGTDPVPSRRVA
jgi:DNA (cytosine-5)-methyltransferase 1